MHPKAGYYEALGNAALRAGDEQEMHHNFQLAEGWKRDADILDRNRRQRPQNPSQDGEKLQSDNGRNANSKTGSYQKRNRGENRKAWNRGEEAY